MTKHTQTRSDTPETSRRPSVTHLAVALSVLALLGAGAGLAAAQVDGPAVTVTDAELTPSGTATVDVVLTTAPNGLAGYNVALTVDDPDVARIESASYPDRFGLTTDPAIGDAGRTVTLEAADVGSTIDAGATDVRLATVEIAGDAPGEAEVVADLRQLDGNGGERLRPATRAGTLTVSGDPSPSDGGDADSPSTESVAEPSGSDGGLPTGILALLAALAAIGVLSGLGIAHRRS